FRAAEGSLEDLDPNLRQRLVNTLAFGGGFSGLAHDRFQESEADHIGVFLMTFAGYDPDQSLAFWQEMRRASARQAPPEILSDHPSDEHRIAQLRGWVPQAKGAKRAFDEGRIAPAAR